MSEESRRVLELDIGMRLLKPDTDDRAFAARRYKSAAVNLAQQLARQVEALEKQADEYEKACDEIMQERDGHSEALLKCSELLGGPEWSGKMPPEHPPNSGDLNRDVPVLISELNAKVEALEAESNLCELVSELGISGWRPIESAPKDGTRIILGGSGKSWVGFYLDNSDKPHPWAGWRVPSLEPEPGVQPTHWKPLPEPPK